MSLIRPGLKGRLIHLVGLRVLVGVVQVATKRRNFQMNQRDFIWTGFDGKRGVTSFLSGG